MYKEDFGINAEWHFFATSHGKGPCDGVGGTIKRLTAKASLQRIQDKQILTPQDLFKFCRETLKNIKSIFLNVNDWEKEKEELNERQANAKTIPGTHKLHSFVPINSSELKVRSFSLANNFTTVKVIRSRNKSPIKIKTGYFVIILYNNKWWLCLVKNVTDDEIYVSCLHPHGPSLSYSFPDPTDDLCIDYNDIILKVNPIYNTGLVYKISKSDTKSIQKLFQKY